MKPACTRPIGKVVTLFMATVAVGHVSTDCADAGGGPSGADTDAGGSLTPARGDAGVFDAHAESADPTDSAGTEGSVIPKDTGADAVRTSETGADADAGAGSAPDCGAPASGTPVTIDLAAHDGVLSPFIFGVDTEGLDSPGVNDFGAAVNAGWQATYRTQNWRLFRFNTEGTLDSWYGPSADRDNFASGFPTFWKNVTSPTDVTNNRFVFTFGSRETFPGTTQQAVDIANWFKTVGEEVFYWEYWNEPNAGDAASWAAGFTPYRNALKGVNPDYRVGGPTTAGVDGSFAQAAFDAGADFVSWHVYFTGGYGDNASLFAAAVSSSVSDAQTMTAPWGADAMTVPIFLGEYNIDYTGAEQMMQTIDGGVFVALYLAAPIIAGYNVQMGGIWTIGENSNFTFVNNDGSGVRPSGSVLGELGRTMGGTRARVTLSPGLPHLLAVASSSGDNWAVWLTNYDTSADYTIDLQGLTGDTYRYWECSPANATPPLSSSGNAICGLSKLIVPARSVVVVSNF